jgi:FkbM family methyltransferase
MSSIAQKLRRHPRAFDFLNKIARKLGRGNKLQRQINRLLPVDKSFSFIQIGANDGISHDPFREFMIRSNARGVAVEPVPEYFKEMCANYKGYPHVMPENCAVGYPAGKVFFYAYTASFLEARGGSRELAGLAGFSREKLMACLKVGEDAEACIQEINISVFTVEDIMRKHGLSHVDCIFMDCEGHEKNILTHLDYEVVQPKLIVFEHTHYGERAEEIEGHLEPMGFSFLRFNYDTIAFRE